MIVNIIFVYWYILLIIPQKSLNITESEEEIFFCSMFNKFAVNWGDAIVAKRKLLTITEGINYLCIKFEAFLKRAAVTQRRSA